MDMDELFGKIKSYADAAIDHAGKLGKAAATRTENAVSKAKVKYVINETEGQIKDIYAVIGEKVYRKYLEGTGVDEELTEDCEKISGLNAELDELNTQLEDLKETVKCGYCGAYNNTDSTFCSKCGAKLAKDVPEEKEPEAATEEPVSEATEIDDENEE